MQGATDYMNGERRLWAAEQLARGHALCTDTIMGCSQGIPANPPSLYPTIRMRVNRPRTKKVVDELKPKWWPESDSDDLDSALNSLDGAVLDINPGLRTLGSAEDGAIALKPGMRVTMKIMWTINPIYRVSKWGSTKLHRWVNNVKQLDVSFGVTDYSMKSKTKVRVVLRIDPASQAYLEVPGITILTFVNLVGAWTGLVTVFYLMLKCWQKYYKPFGLVSVFDSDDALLAIHERQMVKQRKTITMIQNKEAKKGLLEDMNIRLQ